MNNGKKPSRGQAPQGGPGMKGKGMPKGGPKSKNMKKTLGQLWKYLSQSKGLLFVVLILVVINSFAMVAGSYFLKTISK